MAMCPKCFNEKPMLAQHCPNCTHHTPVGEQVSFSFWTSFWVIIVAIMFFGLILG